MSDDEDNQEKATVDVGSGDFQPNPIYGDAPPASIGTTLDENDNNLGNQQNNDADYEYPNNEQQEQQYQGDEQQQQYDDDEQQQYEDPNPPPPYSQDPPAPPAYSDPNNTNNAQQDTAYNNEPEDVVAQMNADNNNQYDEDVGDYGVTQPKIDDGTKDEDSVNGEGLFGNYFIRTIYMATSIFFCSMLSFSIWFQSAGGSFSAGYGLSGFAAFLLFFGSIMAAVYAVMNMKMGRPIPGEKWFLWTTIGLYVGGGLFYFLGGCAVAYAYNDVGISYIAGIFFAEQTFVGLHGIVAGVDLWKRQFLNNKKWRVLIYNLAFVILSVIAFFAYAVTSTTFDEAGADNAGPAWLALFYFVVLIPEILYLVIYLIPKLNDTLGKPIVLLILAASYMIGCICLLIGYFIIVGQFAGLVGKGYFLGVGFFVLLTGTIIAFDMLFDRFIPGYKDGGGSVADQESQNGGSAA
eukprot:38177_1